MIDDELQQVVRQALLDSGLVGLDERLSIDSLGGGVSNDVLVATVAGRGYVVKQALAKLRVEEDWRSDIDRVHREAACQRWLATVLRPGEVPEVLWEDHDRHLYVMALAPPETVNWKAEMLAGRVPDQAARRAGAMLGRIHRAAHGNDELRETFGDKTVFTQLRLDPYYCFTAGRRPDLAVALLSLVDDLAAAEVTLVHGDYSPKNILLTAGRNILLDHEVVHFGEPRFDLGFLFTHLFLKPIHLPATAGRLWLQPRQAWDAYREVYHHVAEADWLPNLGATLLARVDGKSPAEYLTPDEQERVRTLARPLLLGDVTSLDEAVALARQT